MTDNIVGLREASEFLGISKAGVRDRLRRGVLKGRKVNSRYGEEWEILREDLKKSRVGRGSAFSKVEIPGDAISIVEAAEIKGVSPASIRNYIQSGKIRAEKIKDPNGANPYVWAVNREDVENYKTGSAFPTENIDKNKYMSTTEAARILGLKPNTVRKYVKSGKIKAKKVQSSGGAGFNDFVYSLDREDVEALKNKFNKRRTPPVANNKEDKSEISSLKRMITRVKNRGRDAEPEVEKVEAEDLFPSSDNKTILVVPDVHVKPGVSNERMRWLARAILDIKPDYVVQLGDYADMESLCSYDYGKKSFEGRRYVKDIEAVIESQEMFFEELNNYNRPKKSEDRIEPEFILTLGNHEERIARATENDSKLEGVLSLNDLSFQDFGWKVFPFLDVVELQGVCFSHYFTSGLMGKPIGGVSPARSLLQKLHRSCVVGHSHVWNHDSQTLPSGQRIHALVAGCYFEHDESYVPKTVQNMWWRGLTVLRGVENGDYSIQQLRLKEDVKRVYG